MIEVPFNLPEGVHDLLLYLKEKCGVVPVDDAGKYARLYLKESQKAPRTPMKDCLTMLERWPGRSGRGSRRSTGQLPPRSIGKGKGERAHKVHFAADDAPDPIVYDESASWYPNAEDDGQYHDD